MTQKIEVNKDGELCLPEFDFTLMKVIIIATQKIVSKTKLSDIADLETLMIEMYKHEDAIQELKRKIYNTKEKLIVKDVDDFFAELVQSYFRLRLSIKLAYEVENEGTTDNLEKISYFKENFYNEYTIFTGRVIRYLNTLKNDLKEYSDKIKYISDKYWDIFKKYNEQRNSHIHHKRQHDRSFVQTAVIEFARKYDAHSKLPEYEVEYTKLKHGYVAQMIDDLNYLHSNSEILFNEFGREVFGYLLREDY